MRKHKKLSLVLCTLLSATMLSSAEVDMSGEGSVDMSSPDTSNAQGYGPGDVIGDEPIIPNAPILTPTRIVELSAVGMGIAPENTISPAQALALAKRAAIVDAYRQIGEKMYGIRLNAKETVKDMVIRDSTVKTKVMAVIKNAEITETVFKDGLCQVSMELKLDGRHWYGLLTGRRF